MIVGGSADTQSRSLLEFPTKTNDPKSKHASDASRPNANGTRTGDGDDHPTPRDGDEWRRT